MSAEAEPALREVQLLAEVLRLSLTEGMSIRAISKKLSLSRNTVRRMLGRRPQAVPKTEKPRGSMLDRYEPAMQKLIEDAPDIKAPAVLERLRPLGYTGGVSIVRERLSLLRPRQNREPFLTLDFPPAAAMQVDWADFGFALPGVPRRVSALVMALCYSRYLYIEFTLSQSFGSLVRAMDRGLRFFCGTTHVDIFDNMKTVVQSHTPTATVFNHRFLAFARAKGFGVQACNPGREIGRASCRERVWIPV